MGYATYETENGAVMEEQYELPFTRSSGEMLCVRCSIVLTPERARWVCNTIGDNPMLVCKDRTACEARFGGTDNH